MYKFLIILISVIVSNIAYGQQAIDNDSLVKEELVTNYLITVKKKQALSYTEKSIEAVLPYKPLPIQPLSINNDAVYAKPYIQLGAGTMGRFFAEASLLHKLSDNDIAVNIAYNRANNSSLNWQNHSQLFVSAALKSMVQNKVLLYGITTYNFSNSVVKNPSLDSINSNRQIIDSRVSKTSLFAQLLPHKENNKWQLVGDVKYNFGNITENKSIYSEVNIPITIGLAKVKFNKKEVGFGISGFYNRLSYGNLPKQEKGNLGAYIILSKKANKISWENKLNFIYLIKFAGNEDSNRAIVLYNTKLVLSNRSKTLLLKTGIKADLVNNSLLDLKMAMPYHINANDNFYKFNNATFSKLYLGVEKIINNNFSVETTVGYNNYKRNANAYNVRYNTSEVYNTITFSDAAALEINAIASYKPNEKIALVSSATFLQFTSVNRLMHIPSLNWQSTLGYNINNKLGLNAGCINRIGLKYINNSGSIVNNKPIADLFLNLNYKIKKAAEIQIGANNLLNYDNAYIFGQNSYGRNYFAAFKWYFNTVKS
jgi:hypothetical protein